MLDQQMITKQQYNVGIRTSLPAASEINPPSPDSASPYYSTWVTEQLVERYNADRVFGGGLKVQTTLDPELQRAAEEAVTRIDDVGPSAALVAIENKTGEVKAMVGGANYDRKPFNLAINGHRQPGSAFKPFTLIAALENGIGPYSTWESRQKLFPVPNSADKNEKFVVNNYQNQYSGVTSLASATAQSDNSVYAEVGLKVGPEKIAKLANRMGIQTPVSTNPAMTLGGLKQGLTPIEIAYAYSTIANGGKRTYNSLAPNKRSPVAIEKVQTAGGDTIGENKTRTTEVFPKQTADAATNMLTGVIQNGTGRDAQIGEFAAGKTGTTENYGDAWFVGFNKELTVAVWVGYPDSLKPMETEYGGSPVAGGTYPAGIWRSFMEQWIAIRDERQAEEDAKKLESGEEVPGAGAPAEPTGPATTDESGPSEDGAGSGEGDDGSQPSAARAPGSAAAVCAAAARDAGAVTAERRRRRDRRRQRARRLAVSRISGGHGRETQPLAASQKRHWSSTAFVMPIRGADGDRRLGAGLARARSGSGPSWRLVPFEPERDRQRLRELARPRAELLAARTPATAPHQVQPLDRLERADQHGGPDALRLANGVQQRVDAVRAVDVRGPRRAEEVLGARGAAAEGVTGRLLLVVALGLDDAAGGAAVCDGAADQIARDLVHRARVERTLARVSAQPDASSSTWRAWASWSSTRASEVPPSETFDSSHAPSRRRS